MTTAFNFLCADIDRQFGFYRALLGWDEDLPPRSPIFRALRCGAVQIGFNALPAYALLGLVDRSPAPGGLSPVTAYPTFELANPGSVDSAAQRVAALGGHVVKPPFATYYGQWQAVLTDPEGNVLRLAALSLPDGVEPAPTPF